MAHLKKLGVNAVTEVVPAGIFYPAEAYHQDYFEKHPEAARHTCHVRRPIDW
jgi:Peptide methionine sulfoxide reductase